MRPLNWQRLAIGPALLLGMVLAGAGVLLLQQKSASAAPEEYYQVYQGEATVRVKVGSTWQVYNVLTCAEVLTDGPNGNILDAVVFGLNLEEFGYYEELPEFGYLCGFLGGCDFQCGNQPTFLSEEEEEGYWLPKGTFLLATYIDEQLTGGTGWKANPVKNTSTQWTFTLKKPEYEAGMIVLNENFRPFQSGGTLVLKFIRNRAGLYFKFTGQAPMNDNGTPKVAVEIESKPAGLDSSPEQVSVEPHNSDSFESDTSIAVTFTEPVYVDEEAIDLYCYDQNEFEGYFVSTSITGGQGTSVIIITPDEWLTPGASCELEIYWDGIEDVDNIDPPNLSLYGVWDWFYVGGQVG